MDNASEVLFALKPVSFRYNKEYDATQTLAFGLIAEDVAEVYPDLVGRNSKGEPESVRYDQINAMLLNEFLKEHRKVEEQSGKLENQTGKIEEQAATITQLKSAIAEQRKDFKATTAQQQKEIQALTASLKEQSAQIQKVSAQLETTEPASRMVNNNQ
jgi:septal ring factor EnvC (AmiA/AmiB activator)